MKKRVLFVTLILAAAIASSQWSAKRKNLDSLMLENIEALAGGEEDINATCFGTGSVDCPIANAKVYYVRIYENYALR